MTFALLQEKLPGAYDYLGDSHPEWFRERIVHQSNTLQQRQKRDALLSKVKKAVDSIKEANYPKQQK